MKVGVLKKGFKFYTISGITVSIPKGTRVIVNGGKLYFPSIPHVSAFRIGNKYFVSVYGAIYLLKTFNPKVPYPLSML